MRTLLIDDLPPRPDPASPLQVRPRSRGRAAHRWSSPGADGKAATADRSDIQHALWHVVTDADLRWHRAEDIDACAGTKAPHLLHHAAAVSACPAWSPHAHGHESPWCAMTHRLCREYTHRLFRRS